MQDRWYGDHRDLVKWGTLFELARRAGLNHVLQILYYRKNDWAEIEADGTASRIAMDVIQHFRNSMGATNISKDVSIDVFAQEFSNRERYLESVKAQIPLVRLIRELSFLIPILA
jgi:hypothetical protein